MTIDKARGWRSALREVFVALFNAPVSRFLIRFLIRQPRGRCRQISPEIELDQKPWNQAAKFMVRGSLKNQPLTKAAVIVYRGCF